LVKVRVEEATLNGLVPLKSQWKASGAVPVAVTVKVALEPSTADWLCGGTVIDGRTGGQGRAGAVTPFAADGDTKADRVYGQHGSFGSYISNFDGKAGSGATPIADARPDLEVPDLATLVTLSGAA